MAPRLVHLVALLGSAILVSATETSSCARGQGACASGAQGGVRSETYLVQRQHELVKAKEGLSRRASALALLASTSAQGADAAATTRGFITETMNAGRALQVGFEAVRKAVPMFTEGKIAEGLDVLVGGLFDAVAWILPPNSTKSEDLAALRQTLRQGKEVLPGLVKKVAAEVKLFAKEGNVSSLVQSCMLAIDEYGPYVMQFLPSDVSVEVGRYLGAVEDALSGFGEALESYEAGDTSQAIVQIYTALRAAAAELLPEEWQSNENLTAVVGIIDSTMAGLSDTIVKIQQRFLQSGACWRVWEERERAHADQCPEEHHFDGLRWCFAEGTSPPTQIKNELGCLDAGSWMKRLVRGVRTKPCDTATLAQQWVVDHAAGQIKDTFGRCLRAKGDSLRLRTCDRTDKGWEYVQGAGQIQLEGKCLSAAEGGSLQLEACDEHAKGQQWTMSSESPAPVDVAISSSVDGVVQQEKARSIESGEGWRFWRRKSIAVAATCKADGDFPEQHGSWCYGACPAGTEGSRTKCRTKCEGEYPSSSPLLCGKSYSVLASAMKEMTSRTLKLKLTKEELSEATNLGGKLNVTISALVDLGRGFAHPKC